MLKTRQDLSANKRNERKMRPALQGCLSVPESREIWFPEEQVLSGHADSRGSEMLVFTCAVFQVLAKQARQ